MRRIPPIALLFFAMIAGTAVGHATLLWEYWSNITGNAVSDLTSNPAFPNNPSGSNYVAIFEAPIDWNENYGARLRGYITPTVSGSYVFWISSDDNSEFWISPSDDPDSKSLVASVPGWTSSREWNKYPNQKSAPITLVAGQAYYVEVLHKEGVGGDNVAVGWAKPGQSTAAPSEVVPGAVLSPWTGPLPGANSKPITTAPADKWIDEAPASLQLAATVKDDGNPLPANPLNPDPNDPNKLRWNWSVVSRPPGSAGVAWSGATNRGEAFTYLGSPNPPNTVFTNAPTAAFDVPGTYVLQFIASDGAKQSTNTVKVFVKSTGAYRQLGYAFLSPIPGAEYTSPQTRYVLVRFKDIPPTAVTNLSNSVRVTGALSGVHAGSTRIAGDNRTVIFQMTTDFSPGETVTVNLSPGVLPGTPGAPQPYLYQFFISTHAPDPPVVTARGENPPAESRYQAFDGDASTRWRDLIVPNGTTNFSWIQSVYPGLGTHVVNGYAVTSAADSPERDPRDWRLYGVDSLGGLTLLDSRAGQTFAGRLQRNLYTITNGLGFRGYRLEITSVSNPVTADSVQLAELEFVPATGSILRQYWLGIVGTTVFDLTNNPNYPANPSSSSQLPTFEAPIDWADNYGTRIRGFITAPAGGAYTFWISGDDNCRLWLSTDLNPANKVMIAEITQWTSPREWNKFASQKSAPINLAAGQSYYVEALHKEGAGGDNVAVGWAKPGEPTAAPSEVVPGEVLTPWTGGNTLSAGTPMAAAPFRAGTVDSPPKVLRSGFVSPKDQKGPIRPFGLRMPNGVSVPNDFPFINITSNTLNADLRFIFIDNRGGGGRPYNVIFDNSGSPIWYMRYPDERRDMRVQPNGMLTMMARVGGNHYVGLNTNYQEVASYWGVNGYQLDEHELKVLTNGNYLLIALRSETVDMSRYVAGGNPAASVTEQIIQEFTAAGDLIFQWRSWDHLDIRDQQGLIDLTAGGFDFPHINSIDIDTDGNILISQRSTSECTKIDRKTGQFIWRLGGAKSDLAFVNDPLYGPRNQHAFQSVGTNDYILFDNGDLHSPSMSRAVEYLVDPTNKTATVIWQYPATPTPSIYSFYMGNVQRLTNGNTLINWAVGNLPKLTEVRPKGAKAYEMNWANQWEAYRTWRCAWKGVALQPYLILEPYPDNLTLIFNQFGDTNVAYYRIYGGPTPQPTTLLATSGTTLKSLSNLTNGLYYFRVSAVNGSGVEGPFSNEENVTVNIIRPGQNMVANGDFSQGTNGWAMNLSGTGSAGWSIESGVSHFYITNGGSGATSIQLLQSGKTLVQGKKYVLEFDARSSATRYIDVKVQQSASPFTDYSHITTPFLTPIQTHYRYVFTMSAATDFSANLVFNLGGSIAEVFLDNIVLFNPPVGDFNMDARVDYLDLGTMGTNWLRQGAGFPADLDANNKVDFNDFGIFGESWSSGIP